MKRIFSFIISALAVSSFSIAIISCDEDAAETIEVITKYIESDDIIFQSGGEFLGHIAGTLAILDADISSSATVMAYVKIGTEDIWYTLPYSWASEDYSDYMTFTHGQGQITFFAFSNTGETIPTNLKRIKYIIINNPESRLMNEIDVNDHAAVLEYLGIKK